MLLWARVRTPGGTLKEEQVVGRDPGVLVGEFNLCLY